MMAAPARVTVRALAPGDRAEWLRLRREHRPEGLDHERAVDAFLRAPHAGAAVLVAECAGGGLAGMVELGPRDVVDGCRTSPVAYVGQWYVEEAFRRQGVGGTLLRAAAAWASEAGYAEVAGDAELTDFVSQRAFRHLGFTEVRRVVVFRREAADGTSPSAARRGS